MDIECLNNQYVKIPEILHNELKHLTIKPKYTKNCIQAFIDYLMLENPTNVKNLEQYADELMDFSLDTEYYSLLINIFSLVSDNKIKENIERIPVDIIKKITNINFILPVLHFNNQATIGIYNIMYHILTISHLDKRLLFGDVVILYNHISAKIYKNKTIEVNTFISNTLGNSAIFIDMDGYINSLSIYQPNFEDEVNKVNELKEYDKKYSPQHIIPISDDEVNLSKQMIRFINSKSNINDFYKAINVDLCNYIPIKIIIKPFDDCLYVYIKHSDIESHHYLQMISSTEMLYRNNNYPSLFIYFKNELIRCDIKNKVQEIQLQYKKGKLYRINTVKLVENDKLYNIVKVVDNGRYIYKIYKKYFELDPYCVNITDENFQSELDEYIKGFELSLGTFKN